ncbi:MAG: hypothetical protein V2A79_11445 [Planctomycetota bacterium]
MLQWCMFGGYEGLLGPERKVYFTMFGGCELRRPTVARQLLAMRRMHTAVPDVGKRVVITIFGSTAIKCPTLAEEFIDLREAVRSKAVGIVQWDASMSDLDRWQNATMLSFTLFGSFEETALPSEDEEVEALALQRHLGNIDEPSGRVLELGIGQSGSQRRAVLHQAVLAG